MNEEHLAAWRMLVDEWMTFTARSRADTNVGKVDQNDAVARDVYDHLGVDLHDPKQRYAMQVGAILVLGQEILRRLEPEARFVIFQAGANALSPTLAGWWERAA